MPVTEPVQLHEQNTDMKLRHDTKSNMNRNKDDNNNNNNNNNNNFNLGNVSYHSVQNRLSSSLLPKNIKGKI